MEQGHHGRKLEGQITRLWKDRSPLQPGRRSVDSRISTLNPPPVVLRPGQQMHHALSSGALENRQASALLLLNCFFAMHSNRSFFCGEETFLLHSFFSTGASRSTCVHSSAHTPVSDYYPCLLAGVKHGTRSHSQTMALWGRLCRLA